MRTNSQSREGVGDGGDGNRGQAGEGGCGNEMKFGFVLVVLGFLSAGDTLTYQDAASHVVVHYPKDWRLDHSATAFAIVNFRDRERPPQMLVPPGKEMIILEAPDVATADDYIRKNRLTADEGYVAKAGEVDAGGSHVGTRELRQERNQFLPEGHLLMNIFTVQGKLYEAQLIYRGAARSTKYEGVYYDALLKSLEFPRAN